MWPVNNNPLLAFLETDARPFALRHFHAVVLQCVDHVVPSEVHRGRCSAYTGQCPAVLGAHRQPTAVAAQREADRRWVRLRCRDRCEPCRGSMRPQLEAAEDRWHRTTSVRDAPSMRHRIRSGRGLYTSTSAYLKLEVLYTRRSCSSSASAKGHKCQDADSRISAIRSVAAPPGGAVTASRRALTIHELILFCSAVAAVTTAA